MKADDRFRLKKADKVMPLPALKRRPSYSRPRPAQKDYFTTNLLVFVPSALVILAM